MLLQQLVQACRTWVRRGPPPHTLSARSPQLERKLFGICFAPAFARRHASHVVRTMRIAPLCTMAPAVLQLRTLLHSVFSTMEPAVLQLRTLLHSVCVTCVRHYA